MSEDLKTIKELADELSVTKQNIQYHYQRLPKELQLKSSNESNLINSKAEKIILGKVESSSKSNTKDQQIEKLTNLLDQQQRLALQDKKLLEEYKEENDNLKALKMPSQETEFKHLDNQYKDEVNALKEKLENLQEQIKDQKRIEEQEKPIKWWGLWRK
ncbi:DNA-binding protein [Streptococcus parasanguinis]|uniref:DNA-binding protein n=1 Tax=Streptococcus parasanguinis TaxID=1318 RepID=UPI00352EED9B